MSSLEFQHPTENQILFYQKVADALRQLTASHPEITNQDCLAILSALAGMCIAADPPERRELLRALARENIERAIARQMELRAAEQSSEGTIQ